MTYHVATPAVLLRPAGDGEGRARRKTRGTWGMTAGGFLNILAINVEDLRKKHKRLALEEILQTFHIDVCIASESHIRKTDIKRITFQHFTIVADYCKRTRTQIGGGVIILIRTTVTAEECDSPFDPPPAVEACCVKVYPTSEQESVIKITGVYISPENTKRLTHQDLAKVCVTEGDEFTGIAPSHIIGGDFNTTSWLEKYQEWTQEQELRELLDPTKETITTGGRIDKFLLPPGHYIPLNFLPPERGGSTPRWFDSTFLSSGSMERGAPKCALLTLSKNPSRQPKERKKRQKEKTNRSIH